MPPLLLTCTLKRSKMQTICRGARCWVTIALVGGGLLSLARLLCWFSSCLEWQRPSCKYNPSVFLVETDHFKRQNNSITDSTVKNVSHHIQSHHPGLTEALVSIGQCAGLVPSHAVPVSMEDVVLRTTHELSIILDGVSEGT